MTKEKVNLGENLPIDYLSDHLDAFDISAKFVSGRGWLGIILIDGIEVFRSGNFESNLVEAISSATTMMDTRYQDLIDDYHRRK